MAAKKTAVMVTANRGDAKAVAMKAFRSSPVDGRKGADESSSALRVNRRVSGLSAGNHPTDGSALVPAQTQPRPTLFTAVTRNAAGATGDSDETLFPTTMVTGRIQKDHPGGWNFGEMLDIDLALCLAPKSAAAPARRRITRAPEHQVAAPEIFLALLCGYHSKSWIS